MVTGNTGSVEPALWLHWGAFCSAVFSLVGFQACREKGWGAGEGPSGTASGRGAGDRATRKPFPGTRLAHPGPPPALA